MSACRSCGAELSIGAYETQLYCDDVCKQAAYRDRKDYGDRWEQPGFRAARRANRDRRYRDELFRKWKTHGYSVNRFDIWGARWEDVKELFGDFAVPPESAKRAEQLLDDERTRKLLVKALVTDSEDEASTALAIARRLYRNGVTGKGR